MKQKVEQGKTLSVDGSANVTATSGKVEVFSICVGKDYRIIFREGKRLPLFSASLKVLTLVSEKPRSLHSAR